MVLDTLFSPYRIGNVKIKNRIVRSATLEGLGEKNGYVGERYTKFHEKLAQGGTGLIITGAVAVDPGGTGGPYQVRIDKESYTEGHKKFIDIIHNISETKVAIQVIHTGRQGSHPKYPTVAPSAINFPITKITPRAIKTSEINEYIKMFVNAAIRAYECGYDMVQLHAAHGYLLSNFLSPYTNKRKDIYGGTLKNRIRILVEIYNQTRDLLGKSFPITIKTQINDFVPEGLEYEEGLKIVESLVNTGFDAIEPSGGIGETPTLSKQTYPSLFLNSIDDENYFLPFAKKINKVMRDSALILVGGIRNPISAEKILENGWADLISLCRPLIREPDLPNRWKEGDISPAKCISCNSCLETMGTGVYCVINSNKREDLEE